MVREYKARHYNVASGCQEMLPGGWRNGWPPVNSTLLCEGPFCPHSGLGHVVNFGQ